MDGADAATGQAVPTGDTVHIADMETALPSRRRGAATAVLSALLAAVPGARRALLSPSPMARPLYLRAGFTPVLPYAMLARAGNA